MLANALDALEPFLSFPKLPNVDATPRLIDPISAETTRLGHKVDFVRSVLLSRSRAEGCGCGFPRMRARSATCNCV